MTNLAINYKYRNDINFLKGIAIVAVIFYHIGILPYGFLGVETFFVINGYFIIPKLITSIFNNDFKFIPWFQKRLFRLWPIVLIASCLSLLIGYFVMIPDSYENLAESVVASNVFANNILASLTVKDYWNVANEYKPLMQLWYLGVVMQFYIIYPIILSCIKWIFKLVRLKSQNENSNRKLLILIVSLIGLISFILYVYPSNNLGNKFYFIQYRVWEFSIGGLIGLIGFNSSDRLKTFPYLLYLFLIIIFLWDCKSLSSINSCSIVGMDQDMGSETVKTTFTITTSIISGLILVYKLNGNSFLRYLGRMSLSLFVWHQFILAFSRYCFIERVSLPFLLIYLVFTFIISLLSYKTIECIKITKTIKILCFSIFFLSTGVSLLIYNNGGVVRDVPELEITLQNPHNNRNTEYIDQVYNWNKPFVTNNLHVLIVGNSFARDFACILKEFDKKKLIEISYAFDFSELDETRITKSDYLFVFGSPNQIPKKIKELLPDNCKLFGIGTKRFGKDFGLYYTKRNSPDYFEQTAESFVVCDSLNKKWKEEWGTDNFIDIMNAAKLDNGRVRLFTSDNKIISFDCNHLTPAGCKYFSSKLGLDTIFNNSKTTH